MEFDSGCSFVFCSLHLGLKDILKDTDTELSRINLSFLFFHPEIPHVNHIHTFFMVNNRQLPSMLDERI